jgi:acetylornithine aminotransferase
MVGVELAGDPSPVVDACRSRGLLVIKAGNNTVRFIPPLIVSKTDIDKAIKIFDTVIGLQK